MLPRMPPGSHERQRSTKIVATLGPASSEPEVLERMIRAGVDVVRMNFSHGTADDHEQRAELVRELCRKTGRTVGIMADLQGPKIRVGKFKDGTRHARDGRPLHPRRRLRPRRPDARRARLQGAAAGRQGGRRPAARRRQDRVRRRSRRRARGPLDRAARRRAVEQQGHQSARRRTHRARAHRQGHGGHPRRGEDQRRLSRGVVPEERAGHVHGARADARRRRQSDADREDRARRGGRSARRSRTSSARATGSWSRAAISRSRWATPRCPRCRSE